MVTKAADKRLQLLAKKGYTLDVRGINSLKYKVTSSVKSYIVNLRDRTRTCLKF